MGSVLGSGIAMCHPPRTMPKAKPGRTRRTPALNQDRDGAPSADPITDLPGDIEDSTLADSNYETFGDDNDVSPINPRVRMRYVSGFRVERRETIGSQERRIEVVDERLRCGMTKSEIGSIGGSGRYLVTWFRKSKVKKGVLAQEFYDASAFSVFVPADANGSNRAMVPAGNAAFGAPGATTLHRDERLVPASVRIDEQWFFVMQDNARNDRAELVHLLNAALTTMGGMVQQATAQNAQMVQMSAGVVQAMHTQGDRDLALKTTIAGKLIDAEAAASQNSLISQVVAPAAKRMIDRFVPEAGKGGAPGSDPMATLAKIEAMLPKFAQLADAAPALAKLAPLAPKIVKLAENPQIQQMLSMADESQPTEQVQPSEEKPAEEPSNTPAAPDRTDF